jgi:hypothetical protein
MQTIVIGGYSDAPGWIITVDNNGHITLKRTPGWGPEQFAELNAALSILREATRLKTPGMAEKVAATVMDLTQKQLGEHMKAGGVLVMG